MPSPILARADALMQRRRNPNADSEDVPVLTDAVNGDEDLPILLDIVTLSGEVAAAFGAEEEAPAMSIPLATEAQESAQKPEPIGHDLIVRQLARLVEQRIIDELPRIIETAVEDFLSEPRNITRSHNSDSRQSLTHLS
jgi:hypothetical protein